MNGEIEHYCKERKDYSNDNGGRHFDERERTHPGCYAGEKQVSKINIPAQVIRWSTCDLILVISLDLDFCDDYALPLCLKSEILSFPV